MNSGTELRTAKKKRVRVQSDDAISLCVKVVEDADEIDR
jgi:hypothetical protein